MVLHDKKFELLCHLSDKDSSLHQLPFTSELYNYNQPLHNCQRPRSHHHLRPLMAPPVHHHGWECNKDVGMGPQDRSKVTMLTLYKSMVRCRLEYWAAGQLRPFVIIYTGARLSGSGAQLLGPGAQLSGSGAQLSAILVCIPIYVISAPLCMYCSSINESDQGLVAAGYSIYIYYR